MSIPQFPQFPDRTSRRRIGFSGSIPPEAQSALERRGYECYSWQAGALVDDALSTTECIIVMQVVDTFAWDELVSCGRALDFDCRLYVHQAGDEASQIKLRRTLKKLAATSDEKPEVNSWRFDPSCFAEGPRPVHSPYVHLFTADTAESWEGISTLVSRNPAGPSPNRSLSILARDGKSASVSDAQRTLLQRAFSDCLSILLIEKTNGLSDIATYEVHARIEGEVGSNWPYRFFVKLGDRGKVLLEYTQYLSKAMENVPFHLGPRLRLDRYCLGANQGVIVSDYVSDAEALRDCAREGRGATPIANLFNRTLWAWRRAATEEPRELRESLVPRLDCVQPEHRLPLFKQFGAKASVEQLRNLFQHCSSKPVLTGVVHGDLHATNVLVRQGDAVIIDLEKIQSGWPLVFDAASLEGGLLVDGFLKDERGVEEILESISPLYTIDAFRADDHHCDMHSGSNWFFESIRQIRMQARQLERGELNSFQYAWTLAAVLIRKSCNKQNFAVAKDGSVIPGGLQREEIRAMAYVIAERILTGLTAKA